MPSRARPPRAVVLVFALIAASVALQGWRALWEPDEGRYVQVALQMLRSGDWLHPALHPDQPHYTKPPMTYWAIATSLSLFGRHEWAARLPANLAFLLTAGLVGLIARRLGGVGWRAALVFGTCLLPFLARNIVTTDSLLTFFETAGMAGLIAAATANTTDRRRLWSLLGWLAFGLAFLTKGPPALLPLLGLALWAGLGRRGWQWLIDPLGMLVFLATALSWFAAVIIGQPALLSYFFWDEVAARLLSAGHDRNPQWYGPFKVYLPALLLGALPWTWVMLRRGWELSRELAARGWRQWIRRDDTDLLLLAWFLLPLLIFSLSRSRLHLYVLPLMVPAALWIERALGEAFPGQRTRAALVVWTVGLASLFVVATSHGGDRDDRLMARWVADTVPSEVEELVFLDGPPAWGLSFYLDLLVRKGPDHEKDPRALAEWIASLEQRSPLPRAWIASPVHRPLLPEAAAVLGCRSEPLGTFGRWSAHRLVCPRP